MAATIPGSPARSAALSAPVGAPVPFRAFTTLSSIPSANSGGKMNCCLPNSTTKAPAVRAAAGLHVSDVLGVRDVRDVKDADAADSLTTHRVLDTLRTAVEACAVGFAGYEQQVLVYRDVALGCGADVAGFQHR